MKRVVTKSVKGSTPGTTFIKLDCGHERSLGGAELAKIYAVGTVYDCRDGMCATRS